MFTFHDVFAAAETAVRINGDEYRYHDDTNPGHPYAGSLGPTTDLPSCEYNSTGTHDADNLNNERPLGKALCIVGFVFRILNVPIVSVGSARDNTLGDDFTRKAIVFLQAAQQAQDANETWGEAVRGAAHYVAGFDEDGSKSVSLIMPDIYMGEGSWKTL